MDRTTITAPSVRAGQARPSSEPDAVWAYPVMRLLLRVLGRLRETDRRRPWLWDTAVVVLAAAAAPPDLLARGPGHPMSRPVGGGLPIAVVLALAAVLVVPLWWRRRAPAPVFVATVPVCLLLWSLGLGPAAAAVLFVALFDLALHGSSRAMCWALPATLVGWVLIVVLLVPVAGPAAFLVLSVGTGVAAVALGLTFRIRRLYLAALQDRAARLEIERDQRVRLTAAAERSRVAREMHDIVGHNLAVMVNLADGAAALAGRDPARSGQALQLIGDTGRQAMDELRRVLGVLRESPAQDASRSPQPGVRDLEALLDRVRAAGLPVAYRTAGPVDELGSGLQLTVFRVVQEALTNTLKHVGPGPGARAEVTVAVEDGRLRVCVTDTAPPPSQERSTAPRTDTGHGLVGIRRRAALYDGAVTLGPRADGRGWIVEVLLDPSASTTYSTAFGDSAP